MTAQPKHEPRLIRPTLAYESQFAQIPNLWLRDTRLSFRARGIRDLIVSYPTGTPIYIKDLAAASPTEGKDAINASLTELEQCGYLERTPVKHPSGIQIGYDFTLLDPFKPVDNFPILGAGEPLRSDVLGAGEPLRTGAGEPLPIRTLKNTPKKTSQSNHRADDVSVETQRYRNRALDAARAIGESRVYLAQTCAKPSPGSGRPCGGRVLRDDPRWCQYGHRQPDETVEART